MLRCEEIAGYGSWWRRHPRAPGCRDVCRRAAPCALRSSLRLARQYHCRRCSAPPVRPASRTVMVLLEGDCLERLSHLEPVVGSVAARRSTALAANVGSCRARTRQAPRGTTAGVGQQSDQSSAANRSRSRTVVRRPPSSAFARVRRTGHPDDTIHGLQRTTRICSTAGVDSNVTKLWCRHGRSASRPPCTAHSERCVR
jgi:hypothetical protein